MKNKINNHFQENYKTFYEKYLPKTKKLRGHEYQALCPFHEDTNPSLNFDNQKGLFYCHGCKEEGNIFHFYGKINGLDTNRDFPKILKGISDDFGIPYEQKKSRPSKTYDYVDANGELLFQVCRFDPKDFRQRRPDGKGGWIWNLKGIQTVLYRLPEILQANEVVIVEGEKDCDNLSEIGFTATTCPMGAKKWRGSYNVFIEGQKCHSNTR